MWQYFGSFEVMVGAGTAKFTNVKKLERAEI